MPGDPPVRTSGLRRFPGTGLSGTVWYVPVCFVCPNPALDRTALAAGARDGGTVRASRVVEEAGGKALHAARVAAALGAEVGVVAPVGGEAGARLRSLLADEAIVLVGVPIAAETRRTYTVVDDATGDVVEVIEPSPVLTPDEARRFEEAVEVACRHAAVVACAGSLPTGVDPRFVRRLVSYARAARALSLVDAAGAPLDAAIRAGADLVKPNAREARDILGDEARDPRETPTGDEGAALCRRGARAALVTDGARGATLTAIADDAANLSAWHFSAPRRPVVNAVGCGDAVLGGAAAGLARGLPLVDAVADGMAAAADKLGHLPAGRIEPAGVRAARPEVVVSELSFDRPR